jgi:hypothetical protein
VIPVNPGHRIIHLGETCYASLRDIPEQVDMVDIFRRSEQVAPLSTKQSRWGPGSSGCSSASLTKARRHSAGRWAHGGDGPLSGDRISTIVLIEHSTVLCA